MEAEVDRSEVVAGEAHSADEGEELIITHTISVYAIHTLYAAILNLMYKLYCYIIHNCLQLLSYIYSIYVGRWLVLINQKYM